MRQIILVLFYFPLGALVSFFLLSFNPFILPTYIHSLFFLFTCSSYLFHPPSSHSALSLLMSLFLLCSLSLIFFSSSFPGLLVHCSLPPAGSQRMWLGMFCVRRLWPQEEPLWITVYFLHYFFSYSSNLQRFPICALFCVNGPVLHSCNPEKLFRRTLSQQTGGMSSKNA